MNKMRVPMYIQNAIIRTAAYNAEAFKNSEIVRKWLEEKGLDQENSGRYMIDSFIDCCEYGNNNPEEFIRDLEKLEEVK